MPDRLLLDFSMKAWLACAIPPAIGGALVFAVLGVASQFWPPKDRARYWLSGLIPFLRYPTLYSLLRPIEAARGSAFAIALYVVLGLGTAIVWGGGLLVFAFAWAGEWRLLAVWAGGALAGGAVVIVVSCWPTKRGR